MSHKGLTPFLNLTRIQRHSGARSLLTSLRIPNFEYPNSDIEYFLYFYYMSSRIFENVTAKFTFLRPAVFFPPVSNVAIIIKIKSATRCFFLFSSFLHPCSFFFSLPFPFLLWFWIFWGLRNLPFDAFSLKWLQILLGWFSKNRLNIHTYKHIYIQDSWKVDGIGHRQPSLVMYVTWISQASKQ